MSVLNMLHIKMHLLKDAECTIVVEGTPLAILASGLLNGQVIAAVDPPQLCATGKRDGEICSSFQMSIHPSYSHPDLFLTKELKDTLLLDSACRSAIPLGTS